MFVIKIIILPALVKILLISRSPALCTGMYVMAAVILSFAMGNAFTTILLFAAIQGVLAYLYFWGLLKLEESLWFIPILIIGAAAGFV